MKPKQAFVRHQDVLDKIEFRLDVGLGYDSAYPAEIQELRGYAEVMSNALTELEQIKARAEETKKFYHVNDIIVPGQFDRGAILKMFDYIIDGDSK